MNSQVFNAEIGDRYLPVEVFYEHEDACDEVGFRERCSIVDMKCEQCSESELYEWWGEYEEWLEDQLLEMCRV